MGKGSLSKGLAGLYGAAAMDQTVFITGGAGFIGAALIRHIGRTSDWRVVNIDNLTYAANPEAVESFAADPRYSLVQVDICDGSAVRELFRRHRPAGVIHLAAETHVDRSIDGPDDFVVTNVTGTARMLEAARAYWDGLDAGSKSAFRFHHVSTDEVFGSLRDGDAAFDETSPYAPNSPYAASKAGADHLVRAWHSTYALPTLVTNTSNNYGPWQFPEKLIPLTITNALLGKPLPVYGTGANRRDWLFVEDHAAALWTVFRQGSPGQTYGIGGRSERRNIDVVRSICGLIDELVPDALHRPHEKLIEFVADRPGHDFRYAMNTARMEEKFRWSPAHSFEAGLRRTIEWYRDHPDWWRGVRARRYPGQRLGLAAGG
jgi:dTDP-glucose 4,6-dehydratase